MYFFILICIFNMQKKKKYCSEVCKKVPNVKSNVSIQLFLVSFTLLYKIKHVAMHTGFERHTLK